jgi:hypothetical protein
LMERDQASARQGDAGDAQVEPGGGARRRPQEKMLAVLFNLGVSVIESRSARISGQESLCAASPSAAGLAILAMRGLRVGGESSTIQSWRPADGAIDPEAVKIHGIRPADLKNAPRFPTILPKVKDFVGDSPIVAHAYKNQRDFLDYEFARAK